MSEENDALLAKFIEKASPRLLESMSELLTKQIDEKLSGVVEHNRRLLDEIKDAKRQREQSAADFNQLKTLLERGDSPAAIKSVLTPEPIRLTREQARSTEIYRRAKAQAQAAGTTIQIVE